MSNCVSRILSLGAAFAALAACAAPAGAVSFDTSGCSAPALTQPFLAWGDSNWYALAPGQTVGNFDGGGWVLSGGARVVTTTLAQGVPASVLDLPSGSRAVSPTVCLTSDYPSARTMVRSVAGANGATISFSVSYAGTFSAYRAQQTGVVKTTGTAGAGATWMLSAPVALQPSQTVSGWQPMQIVLAPIGAAGTELQVYNVYLDPRARG